jgi:hypothetical protein
MRLLGGLAIALVGTFIIGGLSGYKPSDTSGPERVSAATGERLTRNEIELTADMQRDVGALIRARGYNCPLPKLSFAKGADAYGDVVQIYCGPADREGVYEKATFRVTFRPNGGALVAPWK